MSEHWRQAGRVGNDPGVRSAWSGGLRISYRVDGFGPRTVVFLHGLAGYSGEWARTAAAW
ncbi:alpha/beta fold hydrolase [Actinopolyspora alba]|uniref:alpha/beta fold hydrolase n=1 Tax=Actinopolyspora alba TaxID=673379 RepID=UPI000B84A76A|nr:hypothetical protein [Actinopolyspora alba]